MYVDLDNLATLESSTTGHFTDNDQQTGALQKGADFIQAFCYGFDLQDAIALLRMDDLYVCLQSSR